MNKDTETRTPVTTAQLDRIHESITTATGQGLNPATLRMALEDAGFEWLHKVDEPKRLLSVVADRQGRRYFRWSYDSHTFSPWRDIGTVHCDTEENFRWEDLAGDRTPIEVVFAGIDEVSR